jgi:hypothetical protein
MMSNEDTPREDGANPQEDANPQGTPVDKFAGKYNSIEDFEKGYWELSKEGLKQREARIRAEAERDALLQELQRHAQPQGTGKSDILAERFAEAEIPIEALDARVEAKALEALQKALMPVTQFQQAEQEMMQKYPDFPGANELQRSLDPGVAESYRALMTSNPAAAMEMAYHMAKGPKKPAVDPGQRVAATSPPKSGGARVPQEDRSVEREQKLMQEAQWNGDWSKYLRHRFGDTSWYKSLTEPRDSS